MKGIDKIRQYLGNYKGNYVIIGGTACNVNIDLVQTVSTKSTRDAVNLLRTLLTNPMHLRL